MWQPSINCELHGSFYIELFRSRVREFSFAFAAR
ncbi:MAG: hypothetical protein F2671_07460 [Actinobacteria bacterium]|nr:hypothetical protein [Actinomycetota bacterium]